MSLPVRDKANDILQGIDDYGRVILMAPTGSGKSTQVPQILVNAGYAEKGQILVLQPRRLAARMLARRVAQEMGVSLGKEVGYQVRFENRTREWTSVVFMTEAILLRRLLSDPTLEGVSVVIFDEFHERHVEGDVLLAWARKLQNEKRSDLKIVVMSATLDSDRLESFLHPCLVVQSATRLHEVTIVYEGSRQGGKASRSKPREVPVWERAAEVVKRVIREKVKGDLLVFMPGGMEIRRTIQSLEGYSFGEKVVILPLHGELPPERQDEALQPRSERRIIVSTNVAETSLTIEGVTVVIDSGLARINRFDPGRGINSLTVEKISQSSAAQRAGRAGRMAPGTCYRLWSKFEQEHLPQRELPEIMRIDLAEILLTLKGVGVESLERFSWLERPAERLMAYALIVLKDLGALTDHEGESLTEKGKRMLSFPLHPRFSRMLLEAERLNCVQGACLAAALLQGRDILLRKVDKRVQAQREKLWGGITDSDLFVQIRAWNWAGQRGFDRQACDAIGIHGLSSLEVKKSLEQLLSLSEEMELLSKEQIRSQTERADSLLQCILVAFSDQVAKRQDGGSLRCEMVHGRSGEISRNSVVRRSDMVVALRVRETDSLTAGKAVQTFLEQVSRVDETWLQELFPNDFAEKDALSFDKQNRRVVRAQLRTFRGLVLEEIKKDATSSEEASRLLAQEVIQGNLVLKHWNHEVEQWILRLNQLAHWCPELELPPIHEEGKLMLLEQVCEGSVTYKQIKEKPVFPVIKKWLSYEQLESLQAYAPERIKIHEKRSAKVEYHPEKNPTIRVKIQDLYDAPKSYPIAMNRVKCRIEVLAPNMRPVQVTDDLESFWKEGYEKIKPELKRRYPKHEWR